MTLKNDQKLQSKNDLYYRPRGYQYEMFEASLKQNIIVAMDTGTGKTQVALLRIAYELEGGSCKLTWFLTPTVALCLQQYEVIRSHLPAVKACTITGLDKVERWKSQDIWDALLKDKHVVVSTHAVLFEALTHGFVRMSQLGLLIFDEAHHCMRRHPANMIMFDFYHPTMKEHGGDSVPRILGLTASPVVRSKSQDLRTLESNLDSVCKTPQVYKQELTMYTHRPELLKLVYNPIDIDMTSGSRALQALLHAWESIDGDGDPDAILYSGSNCHTNGGLKTLMRRKSICNEQIERFVTRSRHIFEELGEWAADYYICTSIEQLRTAISDRSLTLEWEDEERVFLSNFLSRIPIREVQAKLADVDDFPMSPKLEVLIKFLAKFNDPEFSGLIFVQQRVTVSVLAQLLSFHPQTKNRFRCAAYVGMAGNNGRQDMVGEWHNPKKQRGTLNDFRSGRKNLIVTTSVLEEGIDVTACSVVVCFDKPANLKSYVQRRGRARQRKSTYAIMFSTADENCDLPKWQMLEQAMVKAYQDEERHIREAQAQEDIDMDENIPERIIVEATGAVITPDSVVSHLYHFCAVLPEERYVDNRPEFSFEKDKLGLIKGTVILPSCVHPKVRRIEGKLWWKTERAAVKESAFQAYRALYEFGLLNNHLLPLTNNPEFKPNDVSTLPSVVEVSEQHDPWAEWACSWDCPDIHQMRIGLESNGHPTDGLCMKMIAPTFLPPLAPMTLFWDRETTLTLSFDVPERIPTMAADCVKNMRAITALYLQAPRSRQLPDQHDFVTLFGPDLPSTELADWLILNAGHEPGLEVYSKGVMPAAMGIVRDLSRYNAPFFCQKWIVSKAGPVELECGPIPRRRNFLHPLTLENGQCDATVETEAVAAKVHMVAADRCIISKFPVSVAMFGLFIPLIVDRLESTLLATRLSATILCDVGFRNIQHVVTAITAPSAQGETNYQRYEFLGDSILKFTVSCQLFFENFNWPEGFLTEGRTAIVQNPRLTRAALDVGLDAFIVSKVLTPRRWTAPLISTRLTAAPSKRQMSSKVLADVVEALIGAAYLDGGHAKAQACMHCFLPEVNRQPLDIAAMTASSDAEPQTVHHVIDNNLQKYLGYRFKNKEILIEALTHPSCQHDQSTQSYQRLEFLGDAILDMVIVPIIFQYSNKISPGEMTLIKHAVVNANLLAFFCMEFSIGQRNTKVEQTPDGRFAIKSETESVELWGFMRFNSLDLQTSREAALKRHSALRNTILSSLYNAPNYPWQPLSQLYADKFFSDIVESVLGAIFVDSGGDLSACERFIERIGLLAYVKRVLLEGVNVTHPRSIAQRLSKGDAMFALKRVPDEKGGATYQCTVTMNSVQIILVEGCLCGEEAEVRAAYETIELLQHRQEAI
ncbi:putative RNA helicase/RNAse III [Aspergillus alliaceus]|uniref:putative RNA helicase/RNAse III n=1 Tax=Petromyces alliaceus TaxID=209559 RepID=UPI0012A5BE54|nr:ATP-dependent helicase dcl2 [Aspergillus alliaceus]KAB8231272.1 ATP-dependent helicase dcl2 [Aspergillus alliaceus]